jgi:hypothetical protein
VADRSGKNSRPAGGTSGESAHGPPLPPFPARSRARRYSAGSGIFRRARPVTWCRGPCAEAGRQVRGPGLGSHTLPPGGTVRRSLSVRLEFLEPSRVPRRDAAASRPLTCAKPGRDRPDMDGWPEVRHLETLFFTMTTPAAQRSGVPTRPVRTRVPSVVVVRRLAAACRRLGSGDDVVVDSPGRAGPRRRPGRAPGPHRAAAPRRVAGTRWRPCVTGSGGPVDD